MRTYISARWKEAPAGYAVEYYSELDPDRYETRNIGMFADGRSEDASTGDTVLGSIPIPDLDEINAEQEFDVWEISAQEFEAKWRETTLE